jgi:hypothetical protein
MESKQAACLEIAVRSIADFGSTGKSSLSSDLDLVQEFDLLDSHMRMVAFQIRTSGFINIVRLGLGYSDRG